MRGKKEKRQPSIKVSLVFNFKMVKVPSNSAAVIVCKDVIPRPAPAEIIVTRIITPVSSAEGFC